LFFIFPGLALREGVGLVYVGKWLAGDIFLPFKIGPFFTRLIQDEMDVRSGLFFFLRPDLFQIIPSSIRNVNSLFLSVSHGRPFK